MKKPLGLIIGAILLIGIGFVLGCESGTTVAGNERSITTEEVHAERIFAQDIYITDDSGSVRGIMSATPDAGGVFFTDKNEQFRIYLHIENDGPKITMSDEHNDHHIRLWVRETGPQIALLCNGEPFVGIMAVDWDEGGFVFTSDKHGDPTGWLPQR